MLARFYLTIKEALDLEFSCMSARGDSLQRNGKKQLRFCQAPAPSQTLRAFSLSLHLFASSLAFGTKTCIKHM